MISTSKLCRILRFAVGLYFFLVLFCPETRAQQIILDFTDGLLPSAKGWTFQGQSQSGQPLLESQVASVSDGILHLNTVPFSIWDTLAWWSISIASIDQADYEYEIRMRAFEPNASRTCPSGYLGAGLNVRANFISDITVMQPQLMVNLFTPTSSSDTCFLMGINGLEFHTYKLVVQNGDQATFFVDGIQMAQGVLNWAWSDQREALFGDLSGGGGNVTVDIEFIRIASLAKTCVPPPSGMVSWWPGDGNAGDIAGGNHGTLVNGATFALGMVGQAFSFDGIDDAVEIADAPNLNLTQQITIDAWVYPTETSGYDDVVNMIVNKEEFFSTGTIAQYEMGRKNTASCDPDVGILEGNLAFFIGGVSGLPSECRGWVDGGAFLPLNTWSHVALTYDGDNVRTYVNAILSREISVSGTLATTNGVLRIGARNDTALRYSRWAGRIDELEIFDRALSDAEIQALYSAGSAGKCKVTTIQIDIKPGSFPNSINPKSKGKIPVAILTNETFDATTVDPTIVRFGKTGTEAAPVHSALEDVDGDGDMDMILHFNTQETSIVCGDTSASLTGETFSGQVIEGFDSIKTAGCK